MTHKRTALTQLYTQGSKMIALNLWANHPNVVKLCIEMLKTGNNCIVFRIEM